MKRRNFLIGTGGAVIGGSALIGSGAFSRVESDRAVNIEVAPDPDAYLGMTPMDTPNGENFVDTDDKGHVFIDIADQPDGDGVNSNSTTWFDGLVELCNNGKADADLSYSLDGLEIAADEFRFFYIDDDDPSVEGRQIIEPGQEVPLPLGHCVEIGIRVKTHGVDANMEGSLVEGDVQITADAPGAGEENG